MRNLYEQRIDRFRVRGGKMIELYGHSGDTNFGAFLMMSPIDKKALRIIASNAEDWDHVSVSREDRTPVWDEMEFIKRIFFYPHELVMQFHVPEAMHINVHPYCLHLWRSHKQEFKLPPKDFV